MGSILPLAYRFNTNDFTGCNLEPYTPFPTDTTKTLKEPIGIYLAWMEMASQEKYHDMENDMK